MTKAELIEEVSRVVEMTRKDSEVIVEAIFDSVVRSLRRRGQNRNPRIRKLPHAPTPASRGTESQDRRTRGSSRQAHSVFQAEQGIEGSGERRERRGRARAEVPQAPAWIICGALGDIATSPLRNLGRGSKGCIFCEKAASSDDRGNYMVLRAERNFIMLNLYPYTSGHLMIAPYAHVATLAEAPSDARGDDAAVGPRGGGAPISIQTGRAEYRDEPRRVRRGRSRRTHPHARAAPVVRRWELHEHGRRDARAAGKARDYLRSGESGAQSLSRAYNLGRF